MVSPHLTRFKADWKSPPFGTEITPPVAGVSVKSLCT
jgi:hypothetical protein